MHAQMHILRDIIYGIAAKGADFKKVCEEVGIDPAQLKEAEQYAPYKPAAEIWNVAIKHTGDELIGLHLGEALSPTILGMVGYLMQNSKTLLEAFSMLSKYNDLYSTMMKFYFREQKDEVSIHYEPALLWQKEYYESARQSVEIGMSGLLVLFRKLSGKNVYPVRVDLAYPPRKKSEYDRVFNSVINFKTKQNLLVFRKSDLLQEIVSHDNSLFVFFNDTLEQKLKSLRESHKTSELLMGVIMKDFKGKVPPVEIAASELNLTVRSLQRKLKDENTTYRGITQKIKSDLALSLMAKSKFRVGEIAEIMGYADSSSFNKAVKKWAGR
jgi:AraC-like DNA-binding protein